VKSHEGPLMEQPSNFVLGVSYHLAITPKLNLFSIYRTYKCICISMCQCHKFATLHNFQIGLRKLVWILANKRPMHLVFAQHTKYAKHG
jgi:hypothetical protein